MNYNDGADYPEPTNPDGTLSEGVSKMHKGGANVLAVSGSANFIKAADFITEENDPPKALPRATHRSVLVESKYDGRTRPSWAVMEIEAGTAVNHMRHTGDDPVWRRPSVHPK